MAVDQTSGTGTRVETTEKPQTPDQPPALPRDQPGAEGQPSRRESLAASAGTERKRDEPGGRQTDESRPSTGNDSRTDRGKENTDDQDDDFDYGEPGPRARSLRIAAGERDTAEPSAETDGKDTGGSAENIADQGDDYDYGEPGPRTRSLRIAAGMSETGEAPGQDDGADDRRQDEPRDEKPNQAETGPGQQEPLTGEQGADEQQQAREAPQAGAVEDGTDRAPGSQDGPAPQEGKDEPAPVTDAAEPAADPETSDATGPEATGPSPDIGDRPPPEPAAEPRNEATEPPEGEAPGNDRAEPAEPQPAEPGTRPQQDGGRILVGTDPRTGERLSFGPLQGDLTPGRGETPRDLEQEQDMGRDPEKRDRPADALRALRKDGDEAVKTGNQYGPMLERAQSDKPSSGVPSSSKDTRPQIDSPQDQIHGADLTISAVAVAVAIGHFVRKAHGRTSNR